MAKSAYFYGIHAVQAILTERGIDGLALFIQDGRETDPAMITLQQLAKQNGISIQLSAKDKLTKLTNSTQHQGVVLQARYPILQHEQDLVNLIQQKSDILLLILDQITDPNNLGACLRTAVAMGVDAVIVPKHHTSSITPAVAKVAVGATEFIPFIQVTNLARTLKDIKQLGVFVYGTALDATALALQQCDLTGKIAIIMGSEGDGIRRLTAEMCDKLIYIPMSGNQHGTIQSLNVSVATGMVLYEANRQRQQQVSSN